MSAHFVSVVPERSTGLLARESKDLFALLRVKPSRDHRLNSCGFSV